MAGGFQKVIAYPNGLKKSFTRNPQHIIIIIFYFKFKKRKDKYNVLWIFLLPLQKIPAGEADSRRRNGGHEAAAGLGFEPRALGFSRGPN